MSAISEELARRSSPEYLKGKAKSMARDKTMEMRDRVLDSPWALTALGGAVGAIAGKLLADYAREKRGQEEPSYRRPYSGEPMREPIRERAAGMADRVSGKTAELKDRASEKTTELKERASEKTAELKERASEKVSEYQDRARELKERGAEKVSEYRGRAQEMADRVEERVEGASQAIRERAGERPITWALGSIAIGAIFGATMPLSDRERRIFRPAKDRLREAGEHAVEDAKAFGRGMEEGLGLQPEVEHREEVSRTATVEATGPGPGTPPTTH